MHACRKIERLKLLKGSLLFKSINRNPDFPSSFYHKRCFLVAPLLFSPSASCFWALQLATHSYHDHHHLVRVPSPEARGQPQELLPYVYEGDYRKIVCFSKIYINNLQSQRHLSHNSCEGFNLNTPT